MAFLRAYAVARWCSPRHTWTAMPHLGMNPPTVPRILYATYTQGRLKWELHILLEPMANAV
jgi:hypothetical protein